jgi:predicted amidophosphoribosyltransferase
VKKRPKFYCEYCATEVKGNDRVCPHCGKFFSSVKCPSCGHSGGPADFKKGCPECGYAFGADSRPPSRAMGKKKGAGYQDPLPWWVFAALVTALVILLAASVLIQRAR